MAEGLTVDLASLLEAAQVVGGLAERMPGLPVPAALQRVADAVPDGRLAAAALAEAGTWAHEAAALTDGLRTQAAALEVAAATYREADAALGAIARATR